MQIWFSTHWPVLITIGCFVLCAVVAFQLITTLHQVHVTRDTATGRYVLQGWKEALPLSLLYLASLSMLLFFASLPPLPH